MKEFDKLLIILNELDVQDIQFKNNRLFKIGVKYNSQVKKFLDYFEEDERYVHFNTYYKNEYLFDIIHMLPICVNWEENRKFYLT